MNGWIIIKRAVFSFLNLIVRIGQRIERHYDRQLICMAESQKAEIELALRQVRERAGARAWNGKEI
jgi:hypothetical protein